MTELMTRDRVLPELDLVGSGRRRWFALGALCLSLIVVTIDTTILNVALPSLVRELHAGGSKLQWIVDGYTVVFAGLLLSAGAVGDRFGRRGALSAGLTIFAIASAASALAQSPGQLVALRAATGLGAALIFPATLSLLLNIFPDPAERQRAIAVWAGTAGIGIALGPVAGGLLLRHFYWGSVFWVNVPVCVTALIAGRALLPTSRNPDRLPLDVPGAAVSIVGLSTLVYGIIEGPSRGWTSTVVLGAFALSALFLAAFVAVELQRAHPMLDVRLFTNPRFTAASVAMASLYFALFGTIFLQTQQMQFILGYDPLGAGLRTVPFASVLIVVANTTPRLVRRVGTRYVVATGLMLVAASMVVRATMTVSSGYSVILLSQCVFALGMGLTVAPATASIMGAVPASRAGVGSAINDTTRQLGGALGVAVMGSVAASLYRSRTNGVVERFGLSHAPASRVQDSIGTALVAARDLPREQGHAVIDAARHAFIHGMDIASIVGMGAVLLGVFVATKFLPSARAGKGQP